MKKILFRQFYAEDKEKEIKVITGKVVPIKEEQPKKKSGKRSIIDD